MYEITLTLHNLIRWVALLLPLIILLRAALAWLKKSAPDQLNGKLVRGNAIIWDIQFLLGLLLYIFLSPATSTAFADFRAAMKAPDLRFFAVEHISLMIVAVALAHLLKVLPARREGTNRSLWQMILSALLLIVSSVGIPWFRPLLP